MQILAKHNVLRQHKDDIADFYSFTTAVARGQTNIMKVSKKVSVIYADC